MLNDFFNEESKNSSAPTNTTNFVEPSADMRAAATMLFQMYTAYIQAGFTEIQATQMCISHISGSKH